jgi:hypothetical protein
MKAFKPRPPPRADPRPNFLARSSTSDSNSATEEAIRRYERVRNLPLAARPPSSRPRCSLFCSLTGWEVRGGRGYNRDRQCVTQARMGIDRNDSRGKRTGARCLTHRMSAVRIRHRPFCSRARAWRRCNTLIRPSIPAQNRGPGRNHRCCSCATRSGGGFPVAGSATRFTPASRASGSFAGDETAGPQPAARAPSRTAPGASQTDLQAPVILGRFFQQGIPADDTALHFLHLQLPAELDVPPRLALFQDLSVGLKQAQRLFPQAPSPISEPSVG